MDCFYFLFYLWYSVMVMIVVIGVGMVVSVIIGKFYVNVFMCNKVGYECVYIFCFVNKGMIM